MSQKKLVEKLLEKFEPRTPGELERWEQLFSEEIVLDMSPQAHYQFLQATQDLIVTSKTEVPTSYTWEIAQSLLSNETYGQKTHEYWLKIGNAQPRQLAQYIEYCLETEPQYLDWAEEAFTCLLEKKDADSMRLYMRSIRRWQEDRLPERICKARDFFWCMEEHVQRHKRLLSGMVSTKELSSLLDTFDLKSSVDRADMLVVAIRTIRNSQNPDREALVTGEMIGLHDAQRYGEANQLIKNYPDLETELQISKQLNQEREKSVTERTENKQDRDYQLIMETCFLKK